jgi:hypothetical protein
MANHRSGLREGGAKRSAVNQRIRKPLVTTILNAIPARRKWLSFFANQKQASCFTAFCEATKEVSVQQRPCSVVYTYMPGLLHEETHQEAQGEQG